MSDRTEVLEAVSAMHTANLNALLILVQTLEEAGIMQVDHCAGNLRLHADRWAPHIGAATAALLRDLADRMDARDEAGSA